MKHRIAQLLSQPAGNEVFLSRYLETGNSETLESGNSMHPKIREVEER
jgi:hypothetical protein